MKDFRRNALALSVVLLVSCNTFIPDQPVFSPIISEITIAKDKGATLSVNLNPQGISIKSLNGSPATISDDIKSYQIYLLKYNSETYPAGGDPLGTDKVAGPFIVNKTGSGRINLRNVPPSGDDYYFIAIRAFSGPDITGISLIKPNNGSSIPWSGITENTPDVVVSTTGVKVDTQYRVTPASAITIIPELNDMIGTKVDAQITLSLNMPEKVSYYLVNLCTDPSKPISTKVITESFMVKRDFSQLVNNKHQILLSNIPTGTYYVTVQAFDAKNNNLVATDNNSGVYASPDTGANVAVSVNKVNVSENQVLTFNPDISSMIGVNLNIKNGLISLFAGGDGYLSYDEGLSATASSYLNKAYGVAVDNYGNVYISDTGNNRIRKIDPSGKIHTIAGTGIAGNTDTGIATTTQLNTPQAVVLDENGNVFFSDQNRVRKVTPDGTISTIAGTGAGGSKDTGIATSSQLYPAGLAIDKLGNVYISDSVNNRVRKVTPDGSIFTIAGTGKAGITDTGIATTSQLSVPIGIAVDSSGNVYIADSDNHRIRKVTPDGNISTIADTGAATNFPVLDMLQVSFYNGLTVDNLGNVYVADIANDVIRKVTPEGTISIIAGTGKDGSTDTGIATTSQLSGPAGLAIDNLGNVFIADMSNSRIRKVALNGTISTITGTTVSVDTGIATTSRLTNPFGIASDKLGNVYFADSNNNRIRKVTPEGNIFTIAGTGTAGSTDTGIATTSQLSLPEGLAIDNSGNVFIADINNSKIRKVTPDGTIFTIAGTGTAGNKDTGIATSSQLFLPLAIAVDSPGNVYIAEGPNHRVRKVTPEGTIFTIAGTGTAGIKDTGIATTSQLNTPTGLAVDLLGNVYIAENNNYRIRKVTPDGSIFTVAGTGAAGNTDTGVATSSQLNTPQALAVDSLGNIYIGDSGNHRIRKVTPDGSIFTVAGTGTAGNTNTGIATTSGLNFPRGIAVDNSGNMYISDFFNSRVMKVN